MADAPVAIPDGSAPRPRNPRRGGRGRGNRGAPRQTQTRTDSQPQSQPPSQPQPPPETRAQQTPPTGNDETRPRRGPKTGGRRGGAGGGGGRGGGAPSESGRNRRQGRAHDTDMGGLNTGRRFQGRLTRPDRVAGAEAEEGAEQQSQENGVPEGLRADAPTFVPGGTPNGDTPTGPREKSASASKGKSKAKVKNPPPPPKVTTKSTAPDIATRIHEDIAHTLYECPICTGELGRRSRVWSCGLCWTVFHLSCVKKWSQNEGAAAQDAARRRGEEGDSQQPRAWRCPGCNLAQEVFPSSYTCWCEKEVDPRPLPGLPPHSCGQTCSRLRKGCPHPCDATCHAGPCTPCTAMGPTQDCFCGRNSTTKRCRDTDYDNGWSCGEICGDLLPCGEHTCSRPCHEGLCGACEVKVEARCYCGKAETEMLCSSKDEEMDSEVQRDGHIEQWTGCFACGEQCNRPFDCGVHFCQKSCHPQDAEPAHCPRSPDVVLDCPCGKTPLDQTPGYTPRTSCEDPIPNCLEACGKILPCGHSCDMICHTGPCGVCRRTVPISCRCGRNTFKTICHQGTMEPPQCFRICRAGLHCGRHACTERCCPGEQKALERQAMRRKLKAHLRPSDEDVEAEHICTRVCGRMLKCGRHTCPEICHKGPCNTCREAIFEEVPCNCGRTVLHPPLPCGTQPPPCSFPCERPKPCGHPQTPHNCHSDDEQCPKCPYLTEKTCLCGRRALKNQPCWLTDARCGQICGELLKCGSHTCQKNCHRPGDCEDASRPCQQPCGKTKTMCGHPCTEPCHAPYPCPEKTPCPTKLTVTCPCGRLRQTRLCGAAKAVASKGQLQQPPRSPASTLLTCDDECARLERNRSLASALGVDINPATTIAQNITSNNLPYSTETLDLYLQASSSSPLSAIQACETSLQSLALNPTTQRSVRFQPAKSSLRAFTHSLASDWGFTSESYDPEPHRHVFVLRPTTWTPPPFGTGNGTTTIGIGGMSVSECVKLRERERVKERDAQRVAAAEAKAQREAARAALGGDGAGGWAQVAAASGRRGGPSGSSSRSSTPLAPPTPASFGGATMYAALMGDSAAAGAAVGAQRKNRLVLRSGVGAARQILKPEPVADSWEEAEEKEEAEEEKKEEGEEKELAEEEKEKAREVPDEGDNLPAPVPVPVPVREDVDVDAGAAGEGSGEKTST
ncbi:putative NF-X1 finger transcription factor [Aspergillus candidus]|uniref:R3H domain-containing protein n=1 Tax=Aspergillus candidus TaxID=41067 RepID=A0A2I2F7L0_ASPCN|nr:hypothetical protein BDW47DRAFT_126983 [Aspergillus candidus]PLB36609.1 hypothetical protein BDW47DRAFT_126983 [Aspergillus candidus]